MSAACEPQGERGDNGAPNRPIEIISSSHWPRARACAVILSPKTSLLEYRPEVSLRSEIGAYVRCCAARKGSRRRIHRRVCNPFPDRNDCLYSSRLVFGERIPAHAPARGQWEDEMISMGLIRCTVITTLALGFAGGAHADDFPSRPIHDDHHLRGRRITDVVARIYADVASRNIGQRIIVDNRPTGGAVAASAVQNAPPDGYTLLDFTGARVHSFLHATVAGLGLGGDDPVQARNFLAVPKDSPANSAGSRWSSGRRAPQRDFSFGSAGSARALPIFRPMARARPTRRRACRTAALRHVAVHLRPDGQLPENVPRCPTFRSGRRQASSSSPRLEVRTLRAMLHPGGSGVKHEKAGPGLRWPRPPRTNHDVEKLNAEFAKRTPNAELINRVPRPSVVPYLQHPNLEDTFVWRRITFRTDGDHIRSPGCVHPSRSAAPPAPAFIAAHAISGTSCRCAVTMSREKT